MRSAIHPMTDELYVSSLDEVLVLDRSGTLIEDRAVRRGPPRMTSAILGDVAVAADGRLALVDGVNDRVEVFGSGGLQVPGDCNQDGGLDLADAMCLFGALFLGSGSTPCTGRGSVTLLDWQGDSQVNLADGRRHAQPPVRERSSACGRRHVWALPVAFAWRVVPTPLCATSRHRRRGCRYSDEYRSDRGYDGRRHTKLFILHRALPQIFQYAPPLALLAVCAAGTDSTR